MTVSQPKMKEERKRHTKPCKFFQTGTCPLSAAHCNFAHIFSSIMPPDVHHSAHFCRFYDAGYCRNGNSCRFRHDPQYYLPIAVDPNWISAPPLHDTGYIPTQYISPYAPPLPVTNAVSYPSPFWLSESYPQFPPPLPPSSQYHPEELYSPVLQPEYISRSNSMDSSSVTSSLATVSDHPHLNNLQVMGLGGAPVVEDPLNKPECIVVPVDHCAGSTLFIGSSGIPKAQLQNIQTTSDDHSSKLHSNVERKPYKTVRCKFHKPPKRLCPKGDGCTFIHSNPVPLLPSKDSSQASGSEKTTAPSIKITSESKFRSPEHALPSKPLTHIEAERQKGYFAVTWRVISGGVQMGVNKPDSEITLEHDTKTIDYKHETSMTLPSMFSAVASVCRARSPAQSLDYSHSARVYKPPRKRTISNPSRVPPVLDSIGVYPAESP
ncbi:hypothetical protein C8R41DRAFT_198879 [Lentinula lateritia]|uniref:C3H1-type domain-containing protein n=1 Tax=Lentinula lateritia TaxID=40482 RepID=A0ABQ8VY48_9AGAR|nr:hypothetical protein C8R41DRAFT_198879 [Lentinula lateritia]